MRFTIETAEVGSEPVARRVFIGIDLSSKPDMTGTYEASREGADRRIVEIEKSIKLGARRSEGRFKL